MLLSLFTPTHNPRHLRDTYKTIAAQDHKNLEWIVLCNGAANPTEVAAWFASDPRVRALPAWTTSTNIGALKKEACDRAKGDVFVELDHDDLLMPGVLTQVAEAATDGAGFVYSDDAVFEDDGHSWAYAAEYGWETYPVEAYGAKYKATRCFPLSPRMLCEVYYAPDHVRCWARKTYYDAGGHDPALSAGDDHDLMCRTYLTGAKFTHTGGCGYLYRFYGGNTVKARGRIIQEQTAKNRRRHTAALVAEWCRRNEYTVLDLNEERRQGRWDYDMPVVLDPAKRYGQIKAYECLQYVPPNRQVDFFNTCYDALVPGGFLHVTVPSETGRYASMNPRHLVRFNPNSFLYYARKEFAQNMPGVRCRFDLVTNEELYPTADFEKHGMLMLKADFAALKGQRHPGPTRI